MPKKVPPVKTDYSLEIRFKDSSGEWSKWVNKGKGAFQTIEIVQSQIRILASQYQGKEKEVRFEWNGWLCDLAGLPTGEVIKLK